MIFSFLVATKSLFSHVGARDIRIVNGSNYITTHWSRSWKSYLISKSKECTFSNHALIVISQLPNNYFHISNLAYPIHLRNQINYNQDPIVASLWCYLYPNCHYVVLIKCASSAMILFKIINNCERVGMTSSSTSKRIPSGLSMCKKSAMEGSSVARKSLFILFRA